MPNALNLRLVLIGFGAVGQNLAKLLIKQRQLMKELAIRPKVVAIADSQGVVSNENGLNLEAALRTKYEKGTVAERKTDASSIDIIRGVEADVVVETTPTNFKTGEPGLSHIKAALQSKKSVITTNKGPLARAFHALLELARHNNVHLKFSGAVGAGTPILDFGKACSRGDRIIGLKGVLNATTNFILTQMEQNNSTFDEALRFAQTEGYAETDASLDVEGVDAAVKLVIVVNSLMNQRPTLRDVKITGIRKVSPEDLQNARNQGKGIRLIASADGELTVSPSEIDRRDPLCVSGPYNAVKFVCEYSGEKVVIGKGAGGMETASSVLRDLLEIRDLLSGSQS